MAILHQLTILAAFLLMLFSPCISAYRVVLSWDRLDQAYFLFEAQVARRLSPMSAPVASNLHIRPFRVRRPLAPMFPLVQPEVAQPEVVLPDLAEVALLAA
jgi:hypothetical protein